MKIRPRPAVPAPQGVLTADESVWSRGFSRKVGAKVVDRIPFFQKGSGPADFAGERQLMVTALKDHAAKRFGTFHQLKAIWYVLSLSCALVLIALPQAVSGQESPITASVNRTHYTSDELVILTVTVIDDSPLQPRPILPPADGLAVVDLDIATNVSLIQGKIHTEVTYTYRLQPRRTGELTIPSIAVKIDDTIFQTAPIPITVSGGTAPVPSPGNAVIPGEIVPPAGLDGQDFYVEAVVDLSTPFLNQQLIYTFRFYQAIQLYRQPQYEMPIFNGFEIFGLPVQEYNLEVGGRIYLVSEIRTALFPETAGNIVIGPAQLMFPGSFFEEPVELYTEPVTLEVQALPGNAPPGFNGAVGQYEIKSWFSPQVAIINQPSTFHVAVSGTGNVPALPEPTWPELREWRTYDSLSSMTTAMEGNLMTGTRVYERLMVARQVGDFTIPPAEFVYFDPIAAEYRSVATKPLPVRVIPAPTPDPATATAVAAAPTATPIGALTTFGTPVPADNQLVNRILPGSLESGWRRVLPIFVIIIFWAICGAIPVAVAAGAGGFWLWQKRQERLEAAANALQYPHQKMHPTLTAAKKVYDDNYKAISQALDTYLSGVLNTPVQGLTQTELMKRLQERGLSKTLVNKIQDCLAQSEIGRYGPRGDEGWELLAKTDELLFELDRTFEEQKGQP